MSSSDLSELYLNKILLKVDFVRKENGKPYNWTFYPIATSKIICLPLSVLAPKVFNFLQN